VEDRAYFNVLASEVGRMEGRMGLDWPLMSPAVREFAAAAMLAYVVRMAEDPALASGMAPRIADEAVRRFPEDVRARLLRAAVYSAAAVAAGTEGAHAGAQTAAMEALRGPPFSEGECPQDYRCAKAVLVNNQWAHQWARSKWYAKERYLTNPSALRDAIAALESAERLAEGDARVRYHLLRNLAVARWRLAGDRSIGNEEREALRQAAREAWGQAQALAGEARVSPGDVESVNRFLAE
jgi:hypothetical protein